MDSVEDRVLQLLTFRLGRKPQLHEEFVRDLRFDAAAATELVMDLDELCTLKAPLQPLTDPRARYTVREFILALEKEHPHVPGSEQRDNPLELG